MLGYAGVLPFIGRCHLPQRQRGGWQDPVVTLRERWRHTREREESETNRKEYVGSSDDPAEHFNTTSSPSRTFSSVETPRVTADSSYSYQPAHSQYTLKVSGSEDRSCSVTFSRPFTLSVATNMANSTAAAVKVGTPGPAGRISPEGSQVLSKKKLQDLVREIDPNEQLDEDVEEMLLQIADDFIESVVTAACQLARHRKSNTLEVKDVQLHLERQWNMWIPGYGSDEIRPFKKACTTEAHKQRMALIRKTTKK
ncbi:hypothetical protein F7725_018078 [Dissostichus mawsoni]|uniref:Transcription initiation factor TFIID subunit 12 n=3 Tax=Nototheniidae TaxID=8206 RepID=A0A7J5XR19_DISMA|nr:hypothetical protein F7725_018078 [Dissostichus mawsoni]